MGYTRMFTASCDNCGKDYDEGFWWKELLKESLRESGWKVTNTSVVCDECISKD